MRPLRIAFDWADAHMYPFWMSGKWWNSESVRYQTPFELDPNDEDTRSGRVAVADLSLREGKTSADFGDEWRVLLKVVDRWEAGDETP